MRTSKWKSISTSADPSVLVHQVLIIRSCALNQSNYNIYLWHTWEIFWWAVHLPFLFDGDTWPLGVPVAVHPWPYPSSWRKQSWTIDCSVYSHPHATCRCFTGLSLCLHSTNGKKYLVSFFSGRDKEPISRAVLRTGQLYYLYVLMLKYYTIVSDTLFLTRCSVGGTIACVICRFIPAIPVSKRIALMAPYLVFHNVMACRAFRSLKADRTYHGTSTISPSGIILPSIKFHYSASDVNMNG